MNYSTHIYILILTLEKPIKRRNYPIFSFSSTLVSLHTLWLSFRKNQSMSSCNPTILIFKLVQNASSKYPKFPITSRTSHADSDGELVNKRSKPNTGYLGVRDPSPFLVLSFLCHPITNPAGKHGFHFKLMIAIVTPYPNIIEQSPPASRIGQEEKLDSADFVKLIVFRQPPNLTYIHLTAPRFSASITFGSLLNHDSEGTLLQGLESCLRSHSTFPHWMYEDRYIDHHNHLPPHSFGKLRRSTRVCGHEHPVSSPHSQQMSMIDNYKSNCYQELRLLASELVRNYYPSGELASTRKIRLYERGFYKGRPFPISSMFYKSLFLMF